MPTFRPPFRPQPQFCEICAEAEQEAQLMQTALTISAQVEEAAKKRPETLRLETLAIVATVLSETGQGNA
ncbi:hypothetical protein ONZ51_g644 [Trametes cubensis]|uniref:Uncharacterized protein n=1 Tax=Trametes cubensis TaxID=1111947 RepID=A0AAD7U3J7_9APHY|nr:hypothetical protein ONZ51_g644 [Trametes cubensis]